MTGLAQLGVLVGLAWALPHAVQRIEDSIGARIQAKLYAASLVAMVATTSAVLLSTMAPESMAAENLIEVFRSCVGALGALMDHPSAHLPAMLAAGIMLLILARGAIEIVRAAIAVRRASRDAEGMRDRNGLALVPGRHRAGVLTTSHEEAIAYVTGVIRPTVVVSRGLLETLTEEEREAVLAHEHAHRLRRHAFKLLIATAAARALAPLPSAGLALRGFRRALEAQADDEAILIVGREVLARAIGRVALGPAHAGSLGIAQSDSVWRARRLIDPRRPRPIVGAAALTAAVAVVLAAVRGATVRTSGLLLAVGHAAHHCHVTG